MKTVILDLDRLRSLRTLKGRRSVFQVSLELPGQPPLALELESDINKSLNSCGCGTGAIFLAGGLVWLAASSLFGFGFNWAWHWPVFLKALGFLLFLAFMGKVVGLAASEVRLRAAVGKLESFMAVQETRAGRADNR